MGKFPDLFPSDFEENILPKAAEFKARKVYRILPHSILDRDAFRSSYEKNPRRFQRKPDSLRNPSTYSTSCCEDFEDVMYIKTFSMKDPPQAEIAHGETAVDCGPCQRTRDRSQDGLPSHIDW